MRINYETCIAGTKSVLVPYRPEHVPTYHSWMKDPYLLEMTGSEPLSFEEEIEMQQTWMKDEDKCTFIVLSKEEVNFSNDSEEGLTSPEFSTDVHLPPDPTVVEQNAPDFIRMNLNAMIGDVNLFLSEEETEDSKDEVDDNCRDKPHKQAELDIMIASENHRRKGMGKEAVIMMMIYGAEMLGIRRFYVKIKDENAASRQMFEEKLGFTECDYAECFREVELECRYDTPEDMANFLREKMGHNTMSWQCPLSTTVFVEDPSQGQ